MLIDKRCPNCGKRIQFEDTMDSMFCPFCRGMVTNEPEDTYDYQDNYNSNEPNLYISYNSTDPAVGMVTRIVSTGVKNTYISGQTLSFHLAPGSQTIVLKIGRINYNRTIVIPADNSAVRIYASYNGRAHISIDQPQTTNSYSKNDDLEYGEVIDRGNSSFNNQTNSAGNNTSASQEKLTWKQYLFGIIGFIILASMIRSCLFGGSSSGSSSSRSEITTTTTVNTYDVTLNVECEANLIFSKYDVVVVFDDQEIGKIDHGSTKTLTGSLPAGKHTITFHESGVKSVDGSREIDVTGPIKINCKIRCTGDQVEIMEFESSMVATDPLSGKPVSDRQQRNGFVSSTNKKKSFANYTCEIPDYWNEDETQRIDSDTRQKLVAKTDKDESFVRLLCVTTDDPDNNTFKTIAANKDVYAKSIASGMGASNYSLIRQEVMAFGEANGILTVLDTTLEKNGVAYNARVYAYIFASVEKQKYVQIGLTVSDNAEYEYTADFINTLKSIKKE